MLNSPLITPSPRLRNNGVVDGFPRERLEGVKIVLGNLENVASACDDDVGCEERGCEAVGVDGG